MEIIRLPEGQAAPIDADCIAIDTLPGGGFSLSGAALCGGDSISLLGTRHATYEEAEDQGLAWAEAQGTTLLYITIDAPTPVD